MAKKRRKILLLVLLLVIGLPVALALIAFVPIYLLNRHNSTMFSAGKTREYVLYVPPTYDRARPAPLVISLHAAALWPGAQRSISGWNRLADEHEFIVVYPSGPGAGPRGWPMQPEAALNANIRFIRELMDSLEAAYNIDRSRIYVNGFSNGGGMSFALSCALSGRIAAVGTVAAAQALPWSWCTDRRPVPMIAFHGTADRLVPYAGGKSIISPIPFPSAMSWITNWAQRNRCEATPVESQVTANVSRVAYTSCAGDADVVLYTLRGGGHSWPGGKPLPEWLAGPTSQEIDATRQMWEFFREHPLRETEPYRASAGSGAAPRGSSRFGSGARNDAIPRVITSGASASSAGV